MTFGSDWNFSVVLVHLHRSSWALSWERRAPARHQKPRWSVALPAKALTQQVLRKCTRSFKHAYTTASAEAYWDLPVGIERLLLRGRQRPGQPPQDRVW